MISALVASMSAPSATLTPMVRTLSPPTKYFCTVADRHHDLVIRVLEAGAALGLEDADDRERDAADGDLGAQARRRRGRGPRRSRRPRTATRRPRSTATSVRNVPCQTSKARTVGVGRGRADDRRLGRLVAGRDGRRSSRPPGRRRRPTSSSAIASASSRLRLVDPSLDCVVGLIVSRFVPSWSSWSVMLRGRALADADEGDDRGDADDHAEHRQDRAQPARAQARRARDAAAPPRLMPRPARRAGGPGGWPRRRPRHRG